MATRDSEAKARARWAALETRRDEHEPVMRLANMLFVTMIRSGARCVRVRSDAAPTIQQCGATGWSPLDGFEPPLRIAEPLVWRLKQMADIAVEKMLAFDATTHIVVGARPDQTHDYDVHFSRCEKGSVIVIAKAPTEPSEPYDAGRVRRAWILLSHAEDAPAREETLALVREATTLVGDGDVMRERVLLRAASICFGSGLYAEALSLLGAALSLTTNVRRRAHAERTIGAIHEDHWRLAEAKTWYARALATADGAPAPLLDAVSPALDRADVAMKEEDFETAERWLARGESMIADVFGETSAAFVGTRARRVELMRLRGEASAAERVAAEALEAAQRFALSEDADALRYELAELVHARGDAAAAVAHLRDLLRAPTRYPPRARAHVLLARSLRALGKEAEASAALRAASTLVGGILPSDHPLSLEIELELAQLDATSPYR